MTAVATPSKKPLAVALYVRGQAYFEAKYHQFAVNDLKQAVELHPTLWPARLLLAKAYLSTWKSNEAVEQYRLVFAHDPTLKETHATDFAEALSRYAQTLNGPTSRSNSIQVYEEALTLNPANAKDIRASLADVYISRGCDFDKAKQYQQAADDFETAMKWKPNYALALRNRGLMFQQLKRHQAAIDDFGEALRLEPTAKKVYRWRAQCFRELREYDLALSDIALAAEFEPTSGLVFVDLGYIRECMNHDDLALEAYTKACTVDAAYYRGWYNRAGLYIKRKEYEAALADLLEAERIEARKARTERDRDVPWRKAEVLQDMRRYDEALAAIDDALALDDKHAPVHNKKGRIYEAMGNYKQALKTFDHALQVDQNNSWSWYYRAGTHMKLGNLDKANADLAEALRLSPSQGWFHARKAALAWREKRRDEAVQASYRAVELLPTEASFVSDRAWYNYFTGNKEQAWKDYEESIRLDPKSASVWYNWADALCSENRLEEALETITKGIQYETLSDGDYPHLQARVLRKLKRFDEALVSVELALRRNPTSTKYLGTKGGVLCGLKRYADAKAAYEEAVTPTSKDVDAINLLAWFLATCADATLRDGPRALLLAKKAVRLNERKSAYVVDTLAGAYACVGRFKDAVKTEKEAIALLNGGPDTDNYGLRLALYKQKKMHTE